MKIKSLINKIILQEMNNLNETTLKITKDDRIKSGWVMGTVDNYFFQAKVFDEPSEYGIKSGRISKLIISSDKNNWSWDNIIINYDRGWDIRPKTPEHKKLLSDILKFLEKLPVSE